MEKTIERLYVAAFKYYGDHHDFPASAAALVPEYLPKVLSDPWGCEYTVCTSAYGSPRVSSPNWNGIPGLASLTGDAPNCVSVTNQQMIAYAARLRLEYPVFIAQSDLLADGGSIFLQIQDRTGAVLNVFYDQSWAPKTTGHVFLYQGDLDSPERVDITDSNQTCLAVCALVQDCIDGQFTGSGLPSKCSHHDYRNVMKILKRLKSLTTRRCFW